MHCDAVNHDEADLRLAVRELHGLLDQVLLFLEAVWLGEQDVLRDDLEVVPADLSQPFERHALRVDVDQLASRPDDVPCELEPAVRLAAARLSVQEGDARLLDSSAQEVVEGPSAKGLLQRLS